MTSLLSRQHTEGAFCHPPAQDGVNAAGVSIDATCATAFILDSDLELSRNVGEITVTEIRPHCDVVTAFQHLLEHSTCAPSGATTSRHFFLLDSALRQSDLSRYSFLGYRPFLVLKSKGRNITLMNDNRVLEKEGNPFEVLRSYLQAFRIKNKEGLVPPSLNLPSICWSGGVVGYLGYDLCHFLERLPQKSVDDTQLPDMYFGFYDKFLVYDHKEDKCFLVGRNIREEYAQELGTLLSPVNKERKVPKSLNNKSKKCQIKGNFTKKEYLEAVRQAKEYIARGDIYQVNLSQRFQTELNIEPHELYLRLRDINPAPFSAYLQFEDNFIVSASPERFLRVQSGRVETRPIKGTRPRGIDLASDQRLMTELLYSTKDDAELTMIVDLERNDLGKVCNYGSVKVIEKKRLEAHPTVFHLVATIEGNLYPQYDLIDLLKATFPGGSVTGAPKIRAMEIIDELEPTSRSVYTGAIGYIGFDGSMDLSIAIRTFLIKGASARTPAATAFFQAGGGIVADSQPEEEYQETLFKSRALIESLNGYRR